MSAQDVLSRVAWEIGQNGGRTLFGQDDLIVKQLLQIIFTAGEDISKRTEWQKLHATYTNISDSNPDLLAPSIALPDDFRELQEGGSIYQISDEGRYIPIEIITSPEQWAMLRARTFSNRPQKIYARLSSGLIHFYPNAGAGVYINYISKFWNLDRGSKLQSAHELFAIPEDLLVRASVWRWRRQKGLAFADLQSEYEADLIEAVAADRGIS